MKMGCILTSNDLYMAVSIIFKIEMLFLAFEAYKGEKEKRMKS